MQEEEEASSTMDPLSLFNYGMKAPMTREEYRGRLAPVKSTEPSVDNKFELYNISTIPPIVSTEFFAKCRRDSRAQQFDSSHHLHVR